MEPDNKKNEHINLRINDIPPLPPITDDMSNDYIVEHYPVGDNELLIFTNWMLRNWHKLYISNMANLIKMEYYNTDATSNGISKGEIVRRILEFNYRYINHSKNLKETLKKNYGHLLDEDSHKRYFDDTKGSEDEK